MLIEQCNMNFKDDPNATVFSVQLPVFLLFSICSSSSLGHSPDQLSTRRQCYSGERVCDDMHSNSSGRTDSDP